MTDLAGLTTPDGFDELAQVLSRWVPQQRWFAGKARDFTALRLHDAALLTADNESDIVLEVLVEVDYDDGHTERYQVPLAAGDPSNEGGVGWVGGIHLVDATFVPAAARVLTALTHASAERLTARGDLLFGVALDDESIPLDNPRRMSAEQSNTSIVLGDAVIYKLFRRLESGQNPDVEVTRALTEAGFPYAPRQRGASGIRHADGSTTALGVLADFVTGGREGWALATADVGRTVHGDGGDPDIFDRIADLGRAVAQMHAALARTLGSRETEPDDLSTWVDAMERQAVHVLQTARRRAPDETGTILVRWEEIRAAIDRLAEEKATGPLTRIHGDLHLGQVLLDADDRWQLLDFEGEPAKPLEERRALNAPLRDVAGMLRSFDYAAASGSGGDLEHVPEAAAQWRDTARRRFLDAYLEAAAGTEVLPDNDASVAAQLDAFELDKAIYELGYELANRPTWIPIPVGGITRVLDHQA